MDSVAYGAMQVRPTLAEWFAQPMVETVESSEPTGSYGVQLYLARLAPTYEKLLTPNVQDNFVIVLRRGVTRIQTDFRVSGSYETLLPPGSLEIIPPQFDGASNWLAPVEVGFVRLSSQLLSSFGEYAFKGDPDHVSLVPQFGIYDSFVQQLTEALCREMNDLAFLDSLFIESVAQTLALHLLRRYSNVTVRTARERRTPCLNTVQRRQLDAYIHEHLDQKITLANMAHLVHVSVSHFERMFRATYHCAPYQYVLQQRLEHARWMLTYTQSPLFEVARCCGFADQSHFTRHFSRWLGVSPGRYAKNRQQ